MITHAILTNKLIDYAGLFPPAGLGMAAALAEYAAARTSTDASMLGRFVLPATRLAEFGECAQLMLASLAEPWPLSALIGPDSAQDLAALTAFNQTYGSLALVDTVEVRASGVAEIETLRALIPPQIHAYVEIPHHAKVRELIEALYTTGLRAKIRTGGVTAEAFPSAMLLLHYLMSFAELGVPFKATAGLHHPLRGTYRLTYAPDSPRTPMFGFLNLLLATAFLRTDDRSLALGALLEEQPAMLLFADDALIWRGVRLNHQALLDVRQHGMISFGSCSFSEPSLELRRILTPEDTRMP